MGAEKGMMTPEAATDAFKFNRAELLRNLPFYIDELTNTEGKQLSNLVYQISAGEQRGRMSSGSNQERTRGSHGIFYVLPPATQASFSVFQQISKRRKQRRSGY